MKEKKEIKVTDHTVCPFFQEEATFCTIDDDTCVTVDGSIVAGELWPCPMKDKDILVTLGDEDADGGS